MTKEKWLIFILATLCLLPPAIILTCYVVYINTTPFTLSIKDISNSANDWSAFGSLMAGIFTFSGALATFLALLMALRQNKKLSEDALKKAEFDAKVASENSEYMKDQKTKMNFEKYKIHLEVFHELLDRIEKDSNGDNVFTSRNEFYKNLFPDNSFDSCITTPDKEKRTPNGVLDILDATQYIAGRIKNNTYHKSFRLFIDDILSLKSMIMVITKRDKKEGDIIFNGRYIVFNIYDVYNDIDFISTTVDTISSFCGLTNSHNITSSMSTERLLLSCDSFFSHQKRVPSRNYTPPYELIKSNHIDALIKLYRLLNTSPSPTNNMIKPATDYIWRTLSSPNISKLINNDEYQDLLKSIHKILITQKEQSIITYANENIDESFSPYFYEIGSMTRI